MDIKSIIKEIASIMSSRFMFMMLIIACILIFYDSKALKREEIYKESKIVKCIGIVYLILGIGLYIGGKYI